VGYRNNRNQFRPRPPKGPVKLAFGLVEKKEDAKVPLPPKPPEPLPRQDIVGTLIHKGVKIDDVKPLPGSYVERVLANLSRIYEEGRFLNARSILDYKEGELLVSFSYDQNSVDRIKGLDRNERAWDPDLKMWRVFPGAFDDVLDILGRGVKITDEAIEVLRDFVRSNYYAHIARGKMGKLIVREAWYEELDLENALPPVPAAQGSSAARGQSEEEDPRMAAIRARVHTFPFKRKPYKHQLEGMEYLLANDEAALLDEMGCGKSFQIASSVGILLRTQEIERVLIVAPMSLVKTWQEELRLATDEPYQVIGGSPAQRTKQLASTAKIFVVHYEGLRLEEARLAEWLGGGKSMLVFDESQRIKNLEAQTTQAALRLRPHTARCVIATGTPIANRPLDLFAQYLVMDKGRTFGTKFPAFKNTFCEIDIQKIQVGRKTIRVEKFIGVRNSEELRKRIMSTSLRRLKSEVLDLPPVLYKDFIVDLKAEQKSMYMQMRDNLRVELQNMSSDQVSAEASTIMVKLLRLSQIASNPALLDPAYEGPNAKLSELDDLLEDIFADDTKKVILWSHYVQNVAFLVERYNEKWEGKYRVVGHTGDMDVEERQESVKAFQDDTSCRLFIATPQSAKEGLTLLPRDGKMKADTMIYLDLSFDSGSYVQSQARFHRIGQEAERCLVIHLVGESTVDEYIRKTVVEKIKTATELLDDGNKAYANMLEIGGRLTKEEILQVL
jgi:SWI/SNF-related matrix-associated actin-dependent regulator 1 of chromatin subfamily A